MCGWVGWLGQPGSLLGHWVIEVLPALSGVAEGCQPLGQAAMALAVPPLGVPHTRWSAGIMQGHQHTGARGHQVPLRAGGTRAQPGPGWANPLQPPGHVRMGEGILQPDLGRQAESSGTCPLSPLFPCKPTVLLKQRLGKARPRPSEMSPSIRRLPDPASVCPVLRGGAVFLPW